jgi:hypothetical protein
MPAALPHVLRRPLVEFELPDEVPPVPRTDVSCYINRDEVTPNVSNIPVGTHCNPGAQATGEITWEWTVDWRVSFGDVADPLSMQKALEPFVGKQVTVFERPESSSATERTFIVEIPFNPANAGVWESGTNPNPSLTYAVKSGEPTWAAVPPEVLTASADEKAKAK